MKKVDLQLRGHRFSNAVDAGKIYVKFIKPYTANIPIIVAGSVMNTNRNFNVGEIYERGIQPVGQSGITINLTPEGVAFGDSANSIIVPVDYLEVTSQPKPINWQTDAYLHDFDYGTIPLNKGAININEVQNKNKKLLTTTNIAILAAIIVGIYLIKKS